jgi:hypothetical protein
MATAGTLLSDLDSKSPVFSNKDDDLVNKILADMNVPSASNPVMNAPPPSGNRMIQAPNPNTTYPMGADSSTATAHIIGKDYPTPGDFASMMHSSTPDYSHGGSAFANINPPYVQPTLVDVTKNNIYAEIMAQLKQPLFVSIIIFIMSLPIVHILLGHYFPSLLRMGGDLTTVGLVVKSLVGGFLFWFSQKILVPLLVV